MSQRFWTEEMLETLLECLSSSYTLAETVDLFQAKTDSIITEEAARKALARYLNETPSSFLKKRELEDDVLAVSEVLDARAEEILEIMSYTQVKRDKREFLESLDFEIGVLYASRKLGGLDQSSGQIATILNKINSSHNLSEEDIRDYLKDSNRTKNTVPGDSFHDIQQTKALRESLKQRYLNIVQDVQLREEYENLKGEFEKLRTEKENINQFLDVVERLFEHREIKEITYHGTNYNLTDQAKVLTLPISDMHYGFKMLHEDEVLYEKEHHASSKEILLRRVAEWRKNALDLATLYKPSVIHYMGLGDDFESIFGNMRPNQWRDLDAYGFEAWQGVLDIHALNLTSLLKMTSSEVLATFTPGNHDRVFEDRHMDSEDVLSQMMCLYLQNHHELKPYIDSNRLKIRSVPRTMSFNHSVLQELNVIAYHGHLNKVTATDKDIINAVYHHKSSNVNTKRCLLVQGHLHHFKAHQAQDCLAVWLPPITGTSDFGKNKILKACPPQQIAILSDKRSDIIIGPFGLD